MDPLSINQKLVYRMKKNQQIYDHGSIFSIHFDAHPSVLQQLKKEFDYDEECLRATFIKTSDSVTRIPDLHSVVE